MLILAMAVTAAAMLAGMVVLICADVALRNLRLGNLPWAVELAEYGLYASTLLGAPWVLSIRGHVAMDLVLRLVTPAFRRIIELSSSALGFAICAVLAWKGVDVVLTSKSRDAMIWKTIVFPEWWFLALLPFAMTLLAIGFLRLAIEIIAGESLSASARGH
jgi:TRAP-type C4-dicarboxylate transport system permease small subunit